MKATRLYGNHDVYSDGPRDIVKPSVDTKLVADSSEDQAKARAKQIKDIQERENTDKALAGLMPELLKADTNNKFDLLFVSEKKTAPTLEEEYKVTQKIQIPLGPTPEHLVADLEANSRADALTRVSAQEAQDKKDQSKPYTVIAGDTLSGIAAKYEGMTLASLLAMNTGLTKSTIIYPGNVIKVSGKERDVAPQVAKAQAVAPAKASAQKTVTASAPVEKPESPESKLQKLQSQIDAYNTAIIAPDVTPENKINMERSKILLIAEKMKIEGTQRTQTFQAEQLARENTRKAEQLATDARKSEDATIAARSNGKQSEIVNEALAKQAPNQQRVKGIEDYIVQLKANPVKLNSTGNSTEVKNYEDKIHMAELDLKTAKSLVENDRQIGVHEKFIADNKDSLGLQSLTTGRNKEIGRLKENNKAILASINNSSTITAMRAIAEGNRAG